MTVPIWLAVTLIALFAAAAWMTAWSRADTWARPAAVALFLVSIPLVAGAMAETLGRHKPMSIAYELTKDEYLVLAAKMVQDHAIYLYLDDPTRIEPRPLVLPFSNEMAQQIQDAMDGAPSGQEGQFILRFDSSRANPVTAHELPQPAALPPKPEPEPGVRFQQPEE